MTLKKYDLWIFHIYYLNKASLALLGSAGHKTNSSFSAQQ